MKLELLTNATVVDDAIRFVSSHAVAAATEKDSIGYNTTSDRTREVTFKDLRKVIIGNGQQQQGLHQQTITIFCSKILMEVY